MGKPVCFLQTEFLWLF